jgi:hypothetical protein
MHHFLIAFVMVILFLNGCTDDNNRKTTDANVDINVGPSEVSLKFSEVTDGTCQVYLSTNETMPEDNRQVIDVNMSVQPIIINNLTPATNYFGQLRCPPEYNVIKLFRLLTIQETASSELSVQKVGNKEVTLTWQNISPAVSEVIYIGESQDFNKSNATRVIKTPTSPLVVGELDNGKVHYFRLAPMYNGELEGVLQSGVSGKPELDNVTLETTSKTSLTLKITKLMRSVTVGWNKVENATGYTVHLSNDSTVPVSATETTTIEVSGGNTTSTTIDNLVFDTPYYVRMAAKDATSTGASSDVYNFSLGDLNSTIVQSTKLNDTGVDISHCATTTEWVECKEATDAKGNVIPYGQDGFYATSENGGHSKELVEENGTIKDVNLGLRWYEHTTDRYTYYLSTTDSQSSSSASLTQNIHDMSCSIYSEVNTTYCNSEALVTEVNKLPQLPCSTSWRLPTRDELRSIIYYGTSVPTVYPVKVNDGDTLESKLNSRGDLYMMGDTTYTYWTKEIALGNSTPGSNVYAWQVNLLTGEESIGIRAAKNRVMLVCPE